MSAPPLLGGNCIVVKRNKLRFPMSTTFALGGLLNRFIFGLGFDDDREGN